VLGILAAQPSAQRLYHRVTVKVAVSVGAGITSQDVNITLKETCSSDPCPSSKLREGNIQQFMHHVADLSGDGNQPIGHVLGAIGRANQKSVNGTSVAPASRATKNS
jgi:hypothetical protein